MNRAPPILKIANAERGKAPMMVMPTRETVDVPTSELVFPTFVRDLPPPPAVEVWGMKWDDVEDFVRIGGPLLLKKFPRAKLDNLAQWAKQIVLTPKGSLFLRTKDAFALFSIEYSLLHPDGLLEEKWLVFAEGPLKAHRLIYAEAIATARAQRLKEVVFRPSIDMQVLSKELSADEGDAFYEVQL